MDRDVVTGIVTAQDPTKRTYVTLEGLRGLAALAVLTYHLRGFRPFPCAYLAVDLFFILSGFVLANRYKSRLVTTLTPRSFITMRIARLYPLYVLGTLLSFAVILGGQIFARGLSKIDLSIFADLGPSLLMLPSPFQSGPLFPFNAPAWSLFAELVVNFAFAFIVRSRREGLVRNAIIILGFVLLFFAAQFHHGLDLGVDGRTALWGLVRVFTFFFLGALIQLWHEQGLLPSIRCSAWVPIIALALILANPFSQKVMLVWISACLVCPTLVIIALENEPAGQVSTNLMKFAGFVSFPLYALQDGLLKLISKVAEKGHIQYGFVLLVGVPMIVLIAAGSVPYFDEPARRLIARRVRGPSQTASVQGF